MKLKPATRKTDIVVQEFEQEVLIYDLNINKAFCLNESAAVIWQMCDGTKTIYEISRESGKKLNSEISEEFVMLAVEQFKKDKLIAGESANFFEGITRREVIRKVGFASAVALPIVSSLIAPISANASSTVCMCSNPGQCLTQTSCPSTVNCNGSGICAP